MYSNGPIFYCTLISVQKTMLLYSNVHCSVLKNILIILYSSHSKLLWLYCLVHIHTYSDCIIQYTFKNTWCFCTVVWSKILWLYCTVHIQKYCYFIVQLCGQKYYDYCKPSKIRWFYCTVTWSKILWLYCTVDIKKYYDCIVQLCGQKY